MYWRKKINVFYSKRFFLIFNHFLFYFFYVYKLQYFYVRAENTCMASQVSQSHGGVKARAFSILETRPHVWNFHYLIILWWNSNHIFSNYFWMATLCSICRQYLKDPRVFPCLHSFCMECINGLFNESPATSQEQTEQTWVFCPTCNYKVNVSFVWEFSFFFA